MGCDISMLFTKEELVQLQQEALNELPTQNEKEFSYDHDAICNEINVLWNDGESSELFHGGNEFWEMYPTVN